VTKIRRIPPRVWLTQAPLLTQRGPGAVTRSPHHDHPHPEVSTLKGLTTDLAGRYKFTARSGGSRDPALVEADMAALDRDGYVIWEGRQQSHPVRRNPLRCFLCRSPMGRPRVFVVHDGFFFREQRGDKNVVIWIPRGDRGHHPKPRWAAAMLLKLFRTLGRRR